MKSTLIIYSSKTGNTRKVAEVIHEVNPNSQIISCNNVKIDDINQAEYIIMGYWIDKGMPDKEALKIIEKIHNKKVGIFFTLGAYPDSDHATNMLNEGLILFGKNNNEIISTFICQGKINPALTKRFESLPDWHPHAMNDDRRKRHKDAESHPDENDLDKAKEIFKDFGEN